MLSPKCPNSFSSNEDSSNIMRPHKKSEGESTKAAKGLTPAVQIQCRAFSLVSYDISSDSDDEADAELPLQCIKKEVPDPEEKELEVKEHNCNSIEQHQLHETLLPTKESTPILTNEADHKEVTPLKNHIHRETLIIPSDTENEPSSGFSSDSEPDSLSSSLEDESSSVISSKSDSSSESFLEDDKPSISSLDRLKVKGVKERKEEAQAQNSPAVTTKRNEQQILGTAKKNLLKDDFDLPPIEDLQISVEEEETKTIGTIVQIVDSQVIIQAYPNLPAINLDSVLFVDRGRRALGKVFDVFGPVQQPLYVVRFTSSEHLKEEEVPKGTLIYYAPQTEHTHYVILDELLSARGSDASWKHNREPPVQFLDYSDDEEEKKARLAHRSSRRTTNGSQSTITHELESSPKKCRNDGKDSSVNPFGRSFDQRRLMSVPRIERNSFFNFGPGSYSMESERNRRSTQDYHKPNFRFGAPPQCSTSASPFPCFPSPSSHFPSNYHHRPPLSTQTRSPVPIHHAPPIIQNPPPQNTCSPHPSYNPNTPPPLHLYPSITPPPPLSHFHNNNMPPPRFSHCPTTIPTSLHVSITPPPLSIQNIRHCLSLTQNTSQSPIHIQNADAPPQHAQNNTQPPHDNRNTSSPKYFQSAPPFYRIHGTPPLPQSQTIPHLQHIQNTSHSPLPSQNIHSPPASHLTPFHIPSSFSNQFNQTPPQPASFALTQYVSHQTDGYYSQTPSCFPQQSYPSSSEHLTSIIPSSLYNRPPPPLPLVVPNLAIPPPAPSPSHFSFPFI